MCNYRMLAGSLCFKIAGGNPRGKKNQEEIVIQRAFQGLTQPLARIDFLTKCWCFMEMKEQQCLIFS